METRAEMLEALWAKAEPMAFISREDFINAYEDWNIYPVFERGIFIGLVGEKGPEMHCEFMGGGKGLSRRSITEVLQRLIDRYGFAVTKTPKEEERQHRFNRLIGFKVVGEDEYDTHYRIERVRHGPTS